MKELLILLFYQALVAVNTAVILSGIIWMAKRKDEKDGQKPNPDFTPPPTRHGGGYQPKPSEMPKPPTAGTSVVKPKKRKYDEYSALPYAVGTVKRFYKPILTSAIVQAEGGKIIIPPEEAGTPVSGYGDGKIYGYVQTLAPDDGNDDGKAYPINPRTGEVEGYPAIDGTVYRVYFWTSGKAVKTVRVTPFDGALNAVPVSVYNPAEESVERYETDFINAKCGDCKHYANSLDGGYCVLRKEQANPYERRRCYFFKKYEAPVRTTCICKNCKHFLTTDEEYLTGTCGLNEEITFANSTKACFEPREKKAEPSCNDCRWFVKRRDGDTICANTGLHISANLKGAHCAMFEPKPSAIKAKPVKHVKSEASCENCDYSFANGAKHPGCYTSALWYPCSSFKPIERPASLGTVTVGGKKK